MARASESLILLTQGDPAGIGPEISLKAWLKRKETNLPPFAVIADLDHFRRLARTLDWDVPVAETDVSDAPSLFEHALPVIPIGPDHDKRKSVVAQDAPQPGQPDASNAPGIIASIEKAVRLVQTGEAAALVTNPIAKHVLYEAGFRHPGHTEFLAALADQPGGPAHHPVMMLWSETLAVVPVTVHIPLKDVPKVLTTELIVETGRIVARELETRFGIAHPRLAVAGLNPHAGENGALGSEDESIVAPAIKILRNEGIAVEGPFPADTMFHARARKNYDAALAMYHDQALIPIKTIAFDEAVNVTLGLPFIRTSPDHGTAFDIAGKGIARPDSLIAAIKLAARLGRGGRS